MHLGLGIGRWTSQPFDWTVPASVRHYPARAGLLRTDGGGSRFKVLNKPFNRQQLLHQVRFFWRGRPALFERWTDLRRATYAESRHGVALNAQRAAPS